MTKKNKTLDELAAKKGEYDPDSQAVIDSLRLADAEIAEIDSMKRTAGWKILNKKIREELMNRIHELVKDDLKVQTLLSLLQVADTKSLSRQLDSVIAEILPDG